MPETTRSVRENAKSAVEARKSGIQGTLNIQALDEACETVYDSDAENLGDDDVAELLSLVEHDPVLSQPPEALKKLGVRSDLLHSDYLKFLGQVQTLQTVLGEKLDEREEVSEELAKRKRGVLEAQELAAKYRSLKKQVGAAGKAVEAADEATFARLAAVESPPASLWDIVTGGVLLLGVKHVTWRECRTFLENPAMRKDLAAIDPATLDPEIRQRAGKWLKAHHWSFRVGGGEPAIEGLASLAVGLVQLAVLHTKIADVPKFLADLQLEEFAISNLEKRLSNLDEFISTAGKTDKGYKEEMEQFNSEMDRMREKSKGLRSILQECATLTRNVLGQLDPANEDKYKGPPTFALSPKAVLQTVRDFGGGEASGRFEFEEIPAAVTSGPPSNLESVRL